MKQSDLRKRAILERLRRAGHVYVVDLRNELAVSEVTIRKDLKEMEERHLLRRTHGGASVPCGQKAVEPEIGTLLALRTREKRAIAKLAYTFLRDGDSVLLDASSTVRELVHLIRDGSLRDLTVITPCIQVAYELAPCESLQVIQIGGMVRRSLLTVMGPLATDGLELLRPDKSFIGVNGITPRIGLTTQNIMECDIKRRIVDASDRSFVLADASKLHSAALGVIGPVGSVDCIITDMGASESELAALEDEGVEVLRAE